MSTSELALEGSGEAPSPSRVALVGGLVRDPEFRATERGEVAIFTIAQSSGKDENRHTHYLRCVVFDQDVIDSAASFKKGDQLRVEGSWNTERYQHEGVWQARRSVIVQALAAHDRGREQGVRNSIEVQGELTRIERHGGKVGFQVREPRGEKGYSLHDSVAFGEQAKAIEGLGEGAQVKIQGRLAYREFQSREGVKRSTVEILVNTVADRSLQQDRSREQQLAVSPEVAPRGVAAGKETSREGPGAQQAPRRLRVVARAKARDGQERGLGKSL